MSQTWRSAVRAFFRVAQYPIVGMNHSIPVIMEVETTNLNLP